MIYGYFTYAVAGIVGFVIALCIGLFVRKCDDIIILVLSVRDRHKIILLQLASFLNKLFQYSGKDYCDSEYSWKDFEVM